MTRRTSAFTTELELADGILHTADHRHLRMQIHRAVQAKRLVRAAPGIVADPGVAETVEGRLTIAHMWQPDGVFMGLAAARLWWGEDVKLGDTDMIEMAGRWKTSAHGLQIRRRRLPTELVCTRGGVQVTSPALTVLDCLARGNRDVLHHALRTRRVTLELLRKTLRQVPRRAGNKALAAELRRARENPWSAGEDELHEFLRKRGFRRWKGNVRIETPDGTFYGDVVCKRAGLIVELDGLDHHSSPSDRAADDERQAALLAQGYRVLRVSMKMLRGDPDRLERQIRAALRRRAPKRRAAA